MAEPSRPRYLYADENGETHFHDIEIELTDTGPDGDHLKDISRDRYYFSHHPRGLAFLTGTQRPGDNTSSIWTHRTKLRRAMVRPGSSAPGMMSALGGTFRTCRTGYRIARSGLKRGVRVQVQLTTQSGHSGA